MREAAFLTSSVALEEFSKVKENNPDDVIKCFLAWLRKQNNYSSETLYYKLGAESHTGSTEQDIAFFP